MELRQFTDKGLEQFRAYLHALGENSDAEPPLHLLTGPESSKPKRGPIMNHNAPGSLYRFIDVIQQLDVTYDLYSMSGPEVVSLLPEEFSSWLDKQLKLQVPIKGFSGIPPARPDPQA
jgi:hypothetical protein